MTDDSRTGEPKRFGWVEYYDALGRMRQQGENGAIGQFVLASDFDSYRSRAEERERKLEASRETILADRDRAIERIAELVTEVAGHHFVRNERDRLYAERTALLLRVEAAEANARRYGWLRDWYMRDGKRSEVDAFGHVRAASEHTIDTGIDFALATANAKGEGK